MSPELNALLEGIAAVAAPDSGESGMTLTNDEVALLAAHLGGPDIGPDPMKGERPVDRLTASIEICREAYVRQQQGVPDQTALVWRWHLGALLEMATRLQALQSRIQQRSKPDDVHDAAKRLSDGIAALDGAGGIGRRTRLTNDDWKDVRTLIKAALNDSEDLT